MWRRQYCSEKPKLSPEQELVWHNHLWNDLFHVFMQTRELIVKSGSQVRRFQLRFYLYLFAGKQIIILHFFSLQFSLNFLYPAPKISKFACDLYEPSSSAATYVEWRSVFSRTLYVPSTSAVSMLNKSVAFLTLYQQSDLTNILKIFHVQTYLRYI